jgi:hypothetical protein
MRLKWGVDPSTVGGEESEALVILGVATKSLELEIANGLREAVTGIAIWAGGW